MGQLAAPAASLDEVLVLYDRFAGERYDESVTQLDHARQTAALAIHAGAPDELVAAALLHDVGHLLDLAAQSERVGPTDHDLAHESVGAVYLSEVFGPPVTDPIARHVEAKRYRCGVDRPYLAELSHGSVRSLALQGGPMDEVEIEAFEHEPGAEAALALRGWDDAGKVENLEVPAFAQHRALLECLARRR